MTASAYDGLPMTDEVVALRDRHLEYYVSLAEAAVHFGPDAPRWRDVLEDEAENMRRALDWSMERNPSTGMRLIGALRWASQVYGFDRASLEALAERPSTAPPDVRSRFLSAIAFTNHGDLVRAERFADEAVALGEDGGSTLALGEALLTRGAVRRTRQALGGSASGEDPSRRDLERAIEVARSAGSKTLEDEALYWLGGDHVPMSQSIWRELGDDRYLAWLSSSMAWNCHAAGDIDGARSQASSAVEGARAANDPYAEAWMLARCLGMIEMLSGNYKSASQSFRESIGVARRHGMAAQVAYGWCMLGFIAGLEGDLAEARRYCRLATREAATAGTTALAELCMAILGLAACSAAEDRAERAARLYGAARQLKSTSGHPANESPTITEQLARAKAQLGDDAYEAAMQAGAALSREQAIREALA